MRKAFTLIEVITVLVIIAIIALIAIPIVTTIIDKAESSSYKRSVDNYGHAIELALATYELEHGDYPNTLEGLNIEYSGSKIQCNVKKLRSNGEIFLSECYVDGNKVEDKKTYDKYYHYGKSDYDIVDAYGKELEKQTISYTTKNGVKPDDISSFTIQYSNDVSCDIMINYDGTVFLTKCKINSVEITDEKEKDNYYHYGNRGYNVGDIVSYNDVNYYVIKNSGSKETTITLLKAEPLTVDEVNQYGAGHVNIYTSYSVGTAIDYNGYGGIAYYTSNTCKRDTYTGCKTDYLDSEIKYVVDAWANAKAPLATEARLITLNDLTDNLGMELSTPHITSIDVVKTDSTPSWIFGNGYSYWTSSVSEVRSNEIWFINDTGNIGSYEVTGSYYYDYPSSKYYNCVVRPVITLPKSIL